MFQSPRGTSDTLPEEQPYWRFVNDCLVEIASIYGYERIDTPVFEDAGLFSRGVGEMTDVMEKETYTFQDRGNDLLTLRPEGTAPVCRAYLEHGMSSLSQPIRLYYICPIFRYERPQSGRLRQHHQFGIEVLGDSNALVDAEVIELGWNLLSKCGLTDLTLGVNNIGDGECRPRYMETLRDYYKSHTCELCADCARRLESNTLRLLDCKASDCQKIIDAAPSSVDYLCNRCGDHWEELLAYLRKLRLPFQQDNRLVRGFDYYSRTVFEITPPVEGRQSTLIGGGRYDGLIESLGGKTTPGMGFGMGMERLILNLKRSDVDFATNSLTKILVAHVGENAIKEAVLLASQLRSYGLAAVVGPSQRGLRSQLRYATAIEATHAVIIGEDEITKGVYVLRNLKQGEQIEVCNDIVQLVAEVERTTT